MQPSHGVWIIFLNSIYDSARSVAVIGLAVLHVVEGPVPGRFPFPTHALTITIHSVVIIKSLKRS